MRKIDPVRFQVATQGTSREINRQIALTLIRMNQPISREVPRVATLKLVGLILRMAV